MFSKIDFRSALLGGVVAALVVMAMAPVAAAVGDNIKLGLTNTANAQTKVKGSVSGEAPFRVVNTNSNGSALSLAVDSGNPPMKVDSGAKVKKLNADRVDSFSANELLRAAGGGTSGFWEALGGTAYLTATIEVPKPGWIIAGATVGIYADNGKTFSGSCYLGAKLGGTTNFSGHQWFTAVDGAGNDPGACNPTSLFGASQAGTYEVSMYFSGASTNGTLRSGNLWALFVPFDGSGGRP